ncbi:MAG: hypothetical protein H6819_07210 [Phycisphaerales bacterium]|nr:hypothetical protein [Phycisphaerales bacterium]MCB9857717.1 hypothetical protein [Phycisphaerales bacterium]
MSLRWFHLVFLLFAIMGADLFGGWALHEYSTAGDRGMLGMGLVSLIGGLGLAAYVFWFVQKAERLHLE